MSARASGPRRQSREAALQVLFAADASGQLTPVSVKEAYAEVLQSFTLPLRAREWALAIAGGVSENLKAIDERIALASARWKVERLASVERNILRVGVYELLYERETPIEVVIDEAVEIARRYAGEGSPAFVNGVLDAIARDRDPTRT